MLRTPRSLRNDTEPKSIGRVFQSPVVFVRVARLNLVEGCERNRGSSRVRRRRRATEARHPIRERERTEGLRSFIDSSELDFKACAERTSGRSATSRPVYTRASFVVVVKARCATGRGAPLAALWQERVSPRLFDCSSSGYRTRNWISIDGPRERSRVRPAEFLARGSRPGRTCSPVGLASRPAYKAAILVGGCADAMHRENPGQGHSDCLTPAALDGHRRREGASRLPAPAP